MTPTARARRDLLARREQLLCRAGAVDTHDGNGRDEGDRAVAAVRVEESLTLRERERRELESIDLALDRLADGTWGHCLDCSQSIAPKRLEKYPAVETCVACQERREFTDERLRGPSRPYPADEETC